MSEESRATSTPQDEARGESKNPQETNLEANGKESTVPDTVDYNTHRRLLSEKKKTAETLAQAQEKLARYEKMEREKEQRKLEEEGEYKKILKQRTEEIDNLRSELSQERNRQVENTKKQAFLENLPGKLKHGEYAKFIDTSSIAVDPDTGIVDMATVKNAIDGFMENHYHLVAARSEAKLPSNAPQSIKQTEQKSIDAMSADELAAELAKLGDKL